MTRISYLLLLVFALSFSFSSAGEKPSVKVSVKPTVEKSSKVKRGRKKNRPDKNNTEIDSEKEEVEVEDSKLLDEYKKLARSLGSTEEEKKSIFFHKCQFIKSSTMKDIIEGFLTPAGTVAASDESDMVIIQDAISNIDRLKEITRKLDNQVPQVMVEAQIVELTLDSDFEKEMNLALQTIDPEGKSIIDEVISLVSTPGSTPTTGQGGFSTLRPYVKAYNSGKRNTLSVFFRYLETRGKAKILSAPNLTLRRGTEGSIITGEDIPILQQTVVSGSISTSTVFKSVGIKLIVKPIMISDDTVRLTVNPEVSTVTRYTSTGQDGVSNPIIAVRNAKTELEVKDGELISIGGLLRNEEREIKRKVPIVGSIPGLGHFFRGTRIQKVKTQLVIFLKIKILKESKPGAVTLNTPKDIPEAVKVEIKDIEERMKIPFANIQEDIKTLTRESKD